MAFEENLGSADNCQESAIRKALRVIPRGKQRLTVYRAHQVACRDDRQFFIRFNAGETWAANVKQQNRREVCHQEGFLIISCDPVGRFLWWREK